MPNPYGLSISVEDAKKAAALSRDITESAVAIVVVEDVLAALQSRWAAGNHHALVETRTGFGDRRGGQVHIDVVGDEEVEAAIAIVIDEGAACVPAGAFACDAGLQADIGEGSVSVVVIEDVLTVISDKEIVPSIVVIVPDANALSPAGVGEPGLGRHIGESAVAIVAEKMRRGFAASGKALETKAIYDENVEPAVVIVIVERYPTASGFEQILVLVFSPKDGFDVQAGFACDVTEADAEIGWRRGFFLTDILAGSYRRVQPARAYHPHDAFEGQNQRGPAERLQK